MPAELPTDIITQILHSSPAKSVLRFRCLSKSFSSIIDSPHFVKTHLNLSHKNKANLKLIILAQFCKQKQLYSLDFHSLHTPPVAFQNEFMVGYIMGSCNGLLLLGYDRQFQLALFNPSTREYHKIPVSLGRPVDGEYNTIQSGGLAYDSVKDDYKVIKVVMNSRTDLKLWVYSLRSNCWKIICDFPYYITYSPSYFGWKADLDGTLHMLVAKSFTNKTKLIVAVDVARENFYLVPKPDNLNEEARDANVDVLGGCLGLVVFYYGYTDVWVMNVYGVKESWTKLFTFMAPTIHIYIYIQLLGYSKNRNEVLLNIHNDKIVWFNLETREIKDVEVRSLPKMFTSRVYVSSLVSLSGYEESGTRRSAAEEAARISREWGLI